MATVTVSTDTDYSSLSLSNNDIISLTSSARLTIDETTHDIRRWDCITDGEFYVENTSTSTPRFIKVGSTGTSSPRIRLEAGGKFTCRGDLISLGTSDGTANQEFTLPKDGSDEYQLLGGIFVHMPTMDELQDGTPVPRLMARVNSLTDKFNHERLGAVFVHDTANNKIILGDGFEGWIPPSGAEIFVPNIQIQNTNSTTTVPIFDLALSGRMDWEYVSLSSSGPGGAGKAFNPDFDNGAGQIWDHVVVETDGQNSAINFNVNAGQVKLSNVICSSQKELIVSNALLPPIVKNVFVYNRYSGATDYGIECFNNTGAEFENIVIIMPNCSNSSTSRGAWAGSSKNVTIKNIWAASYMSAIYITTGANNCKIDGVFACGRGSRGQAAPATKAGVIRVTAAQNTLILNVEPAMSVADGFMSYRECLLYSTSGSTNTVMADSSWNANNEMDHVINDTSSGTRMGNITIDGQLLSRVLESSTQSANLELSNIKFSSTQTNGTAMEFPFGSVFNQTMIKATASGAVGTGADSTSHHYFINEDDTVGRLEMRMSPFVNELDYYTEVVKTGKIVFNQNNRLYIENINDQIILTSRVHGGITDFTSYSKSGNLTSTFTAELSMRRPNGTWTAFQSGSSANATSQLLSLPTDADNRVQVRHRITKNASGMTQFLYYVYMNTTVDNTYQYPFLSQKVSLSITGLEDNTEVRVFDAQDHDIELAGKEDVIGGEFIYNYDYVGTDFNGEEKTVDVAIFSLNQKPLFLEGIVLTESNLSIPVQQLFDRDYLNP